MAHGKLAFLGLYIHMRAVTSALSNDWNNFYGTTDNLQFQSWLSFFSKNWASVFFSDGFIDYFIQLCPETLNSFPTYSFSHVTGNFFSVFSFFAFLCFTIFVEVLNSWSLRF